MRTVRNVLALGLVGCGVLLAAEASVDAATRIRRDLTPLWQRLDNARTYRGGFKTRLKSYTQILEDFTKTTSVAALNGKSPKQEFEALVGEFRARLADPTVAEEAAWGVQETLNELMAGQLLLGNDRLLRGLRARFPAGGQVADPLAVLAQAEAEFKSGINVAVEELRTRPSGLRQGSESSPCNADIRFWVDNAVSVGGSCTGELVENELYRFSDLTSRLALAANERAKRKYFFDNEKAAGRTEAAQLFQGAAQTTYLLGAVLNAVQRPDAFQNNNGYELKRYVLDAQRLFEDILAGFNPLKLRGDFVPASENGAQRYIVEARDMIQRAIRSEDSVKSLTRDIDQNETTLRNELLNLQNGYIDRLVQITGIGETSLRNDYDLRTADGRARLLADADTNMLAHQGELGAALLKIEQAALNAKGIQTQLNQIPEKVRIEEETTKEINIINSAVAGLRAAVEFAELMAGAIEICSCGIASGVKTKMLLPAAAAQRAGFTILEVVQNAVISDLRSSQRVKEILMEGAILVISIEQAGKAIDEQKAQLELLRVQLQQLARNYATADVNLASAYFSNPAYRLQADNERETADNLFEDAMVAAYFAAKALEYEWSERFMNPVLRTDGGPAESLGASYDGVIRAESAFAARSAGAPGGAQPSLDTFQTALRRWDLLLRESDRRAPARQTNVRTWSLRRDVLGFDSGDDRYDLLRFSDFIAKQRLAGSNPNKKDLRLEFAVQLGNSNLLPGAPPDLPPFISPAPNLKIDSVALEMFSAPNVSLRSGGGPVNPADVTLELRDTSLTRTFFARVGDDDILALDLPGSRPGEPAPLNATVQAKVDGVPGAIGAQQVFVNYSPAVTAWVLAIDMSKLVNRDLVLQNLGDILITLNYAYGRPLPIPAYQN